MSNRSKTHQVLVGNVAVGGGASVAVQSMCNTKTEDTEATLEQINSLAELGCEIIRVALPYKRALDSFKEICARSPLPVVADIHFDYRLAIAAAELGASAIRINPGNIGSLDRVDQVIDACKKYKIPVRIGVNAGSLDAEISEMQGLSIVDKLTLSAKSYVEHFERRGFYDIVLSAKIHDVLSTIEVNTRLSQELPHIPLHIGVTEAGTFIQGTIKSSIALGNLLAQGIGDTFRVSLTDEPQKEIRVAWEILQSLGLRRRTPELISCPTCGRCNVNLIALAKEIEEALIKINKPISVACMGCTVNGPGEAKFADIGVACGNGQGILFIKGEPIRKVKEAEIVSALIDEINNRF